MVAPLDGLAGVRAYGFTGRDQLFRVPDKVTAVWLSGIGGAGAALTRQFGEWVPRGLANVPLTVEPKSHIRVRVGGRPDIVGRYDVSPGGIDFEWKLSTEGGWNGGGNGGGTWGREVSGAFGEIHACGGGGATTFHLIPPGANPLVEVGELVAVMPGAPGTLRGILGTFGFAYNDFDQPVEFTTNDVGPDRRLSAPSTFSFAGDPPPPPDATEYLGTYPDNADLPTPLTTPSTPCWHLLEDPVDVYGTTGASFAGPPDVSLGNPGESFKGGPGRRVGEAAATAGGGGGYGGGASGSRLTVRGSAIPIFGEGDPRDLTFDLAMEARHGGFLIPLDRPEGWGDRDLVDADGTILTTELEGIEAPLQYLPVVSSSYPGADANPFGAYTDAEMDLLGEDPDTMTGHGSARIQWAKDAKRARWRVGHVGWGRNNGW